MKNIEYETFSGFSRTALDFLRDVRLNNSKAWYEEHKEVYREFVLKPFQLLVMDLSELMLSLDPQVDTRPAVDKTISRIRRDTRFTNDKSLYRENVWISFKRTCENWKEKPVYFFEINPNWYRYGMGFYFAPKAAMDKLRQLIDENDPEFINAVELYKKQAVFKIEGQSYKRSLAPDKPPEYQEWYQKKEIYFMRTKPTDEKLFERSLLTEVANGFLILKPFYDFLWRISNECGMA